jgi:hypothetical protein
VGERNWADSGCERHFEVKEIVSLLTGAVAGMDGHWNPSWWTLKVWAFAVWTFTKIKM